jgi:hypothetical protein
MDIWTPYDRNKFIKEAVYSSDLRGNAGPYYYNVYPKSDGSSSEELDAKRSIMTNVLAKTIYTKNPKYRYLSVGFYYMLIDKIRTNMNIGHLLWKDVMPVIKGANAYSYLTKDFEHFAPSDLDVMIYINSNYDDDVFNYVKGELKTIVLQTESQFKRLLHNMFFVTGSNKYKESDMYKEVKLFDDETIEQFKQDYKEEIAKLNTPNRLVLSPFEDDQIRNNCSRYSFILTKSEGFENSVVKVDVPHFDKCENIPLQKSPFFCSYNETIDFKRDGQDLDGKFDLFRMRFNNLFVEIDDDGNAIKEERVAADFIDVSISSKSDAELIDFWNTARCEHIIDPEISDWKIYRDGIWEPVTCWLIIPNIATCINDLYKMLNVYECPEGKKIKREIRYNALKKIAGFL